MCTALYLDLARAIRSELFASTLALTTERPYQSNVTPFDRLNAKAGSQNAIGALRNRS